MSYEQIDEAIETLVRACNVENRASVTQALRRIVLSGGETSDKSAESGKEEAVSERERFKAWFATSGFWNDAITWAAWQAALANPSDKQEAAHTDDQAVDRFAQAMKEKMAAAREKGRHGWQFSDSTYLSKLLREHVEKGDPRDVANFCMMLWHHQSAIAPLDKSASDALCEHEWQAMTEPHKECVKCGDVRRDWDKSASGAPVAWFIADDEGAWLDMKKLKPVYSIETRHPEYKVWLAIYGAKRGLKLFKTREAAEQFIKDAQSNKGT